MIYIYKHKETGKYFRFKDTAFEDKLTSNIEKSKKYHEDKIIDIKLFIQRDWIYISLNEELKNIRKQKLKKLYEMHI